jgi:hypothetical protein
MIDQDFQDRPDKRDRKERAEHDEFRRQHVPSVARCERLASQQCFVSRTLASPLDGARSLNLEAGQQPMGQLTIC